VTLEPSGAHRAPAPDSSPRVPGRFGPADAAIFETFVVPRYLSLFGELVLEMIAESDEAQVAHLFCRTGYPDRGVALKLAGAHIIGVDKSTAAVELARAKAATMPEMVSEYRAIDELPSSLPSSAFSHALCLHPIATAEERRTLLEEMSRVLAPAGQALVAMPLRGSFQEVGDLLREYALKFDEAPVAAAVERASVQRPTVEMLGAELEEVGFDFVDVSLRPATFAFRSGRDFFEDPIARLLVLPDLRLSLGIEEPDKALSYVRDAIDKYWSDGAFELTVNVGCATGRRTG
jgi:SAM-dependent methyltransferase